MTQETQLDLSSSSCSSISRGDQEAIAERQDPGGGCSTSMPAAEFQIDDRLKRSSSVKNRAAFFEAMTKSSPEQASSPVSPPRGVPMCRMLPVVCCCKLNMPICARLCHDVKAHFSLLAAESHYFN